MKTIKVIDLLNEMASNEKYKPTFLFRGSIYKYNAETKYYEPSFMGLYKIFMILNDELEIIEEIGKPKEIEKIRKKFHTNDIPTDANFKMVYDSIEEIIKAVNYLLKKEDDK